MVIPNFFILRVLRVTIFFNKYIGFQIGVNSSIQNYEKSKIVNISDDYRFNFNSANVGICHTFLNQEAHKIGLAIGFKVYYGPDFIPLHYYKDGGYYIYYTSSRFQTTYGADFGLFYVFKRISGILKFDTARRNIRVGIGYAFGK